ncbi:WD domain, G-beta repeat domain containing protein [Plasmodium gonderi]|uniref:WD domain, G-beta repeat domain containing protein n=1 Tax=Plasmodium gonderi TaxID=77519 RepID=A0A1Y1JJK5_PLAGO|nr:WD domain, G-beta repeat domain containing protein [Plasmodium gonderi]GAW80982.1 WD domain, G-beta repeat domain containing protein [Plasmodium gonderi]
MKNDKNVQNSVNTKTFNTCFDNIDLNWAFLRNKNLKNGPNFSFFYEYAHDRSILSLSLDESGTYMVTGSADHSLRIHNLKNLSTIKELYHKKCGHYDWVNNVFFTKRNEVLSGGLDGKICLWNTTYSCKASRINKIMNCSEYLEKAKTVREVTFKASSNVTTCKEMYAHHSTISDMKFDKKNEKCITSSYDKTLKLFDIKKFQELAIYKGSHLHPITKFLWLQDKIISADKNGAVSVFDVGNSQEVLHAKNTHCGNIGALNYFYLYKNGYSNFMDKRVEDGKDVHCSESSFGDFTNEDNLKKKERDKRSSSSSSRCSGKNLSKKCAAHFTKSTNLFEKKDDHLNLNNEKTPLIITGGQSDGIVKIRDFRIFHKYISCKKIHTASINSIITYNVNNRSYIITCSADGNCFQFEIHSICSSNLNNFLKKISVNEPILSARYIGNHFLLVGTAFGNLFLLNFSDCSENSLTLKQKKNLNTIGDVVYHLNPLIEKKKKSNKHTRNDTLVSIEFPKEGYIKTDIIPAEHEKSPNDILWAFGACKKGGINCIECIFIYNEKKVCTNEFEICNIVTSGDDGIPCLLSIPNSYM